MFKIAQSKVFPLLTSSPSSRQHIDRLLQTHRDSDAFEGQDTRSCTSSHDGSIQEDAETSEGNINVPHTSTPTSSVHEDGMNGNEPAELENHPANI